MTLQEAEKIMKQLNCWKKCFYAFRKVGNKGVNSRANKAYKDFFKYDN